MGYKDGSAGRLEFRDAGGRVLLELRLTRQNGLYFCPMPTYTTASEHPSIKVVRRAEATTDDAGNGTRLPSMSRRPIHPARHLESELWAARLGHCGEWQLD